MLSTTGSLKDTLGRNNPYRYRGYRYDSDTGLYYLNSRYYNPEWGRFINADGIVTTPGELLSGNMFAYCKNNPVNMSDAAGYRPLYCAPGDEETPEMQRASVRVMLESAKKRDYSYKKPSNSHTPTNSSRIIPDSNQVKSVVKSALATGGEGIISSAFKDTPDSVALITNRELRRAGREFRKPVYGAKLLRGIGKVERVGIIGVVFTGSSVWDNFHSGYSTEEAIERSGIDICVSALVIGVGLVTPFWAAAAIGFGVGMAAELWKNSKWRH